MPAALGECVSQVVSLWCREVVSSIACGRWKNIPCSYICHNVVSWCYKAIQVPSYSKSTVCDTFMMFAPYLKPSCKGLWSWSVGITLCTQLHTLSRANTADLYSSSCTGYILLHFLWSAPTNHVRYCKLCNVRMASLSQSSILEANHSRCSCS